MQNIVLVNLFYRKYIVTILMTNYVPINNTISRDIVSCINSQYWSRCQLGPRYEGQLTRMVEPIPPSGQSSSCSLTTLSSSSSTDRRAETDRIVITTLIAVAHHFRCRLRRRERAVYLGPRPVSQHYPYTNYLRLGW